MIDGTPPAVVIARYAPSSLDAEVAGFARGVVTRADPHSGPRAKALLFAASKVGSFAVSVGVALEANAVLAPPFVERYLVACGPIVSAGTRRTIASNLRALSAAVLAPGVPAGVRLGRERAKAPYDPGTIDAYLALAAAQPTAARRMRAAGLICLGAGAGLTGADLRGVRGTDVVARSGGLVVDVPGPRARSVPVLTRYHETLVASATFAGASFVIGGTSPTRRTVTTPLVSSLSGGSDLERLCTLRLRATWLVACVEALGLRAFMDAAGVTCTQRLGDLVALTDEITEAEAVTRLGART